MRFVFLAHVSLAAAQWPALDGSNNNPAHPLHNTALSPFLPAAGPGLSTAYGDGISSPSNPLGPNPRLVSNALLSRAPFFDNALSVSMLGAAWGQFIAHDMIKTSPNASAVGADVVDIAVPACDANYDAACSGRVNMTLRRTQWAASSGSSTANPRAQLNAQTGWLDASTVYGASAADALRVRALVGGLLLVDPVNGLPSTSIRGADTCAAVGMANPPGFDPCTLRIAGDVRANLAPGIFAVQALFVLEHNWWARTLAARAEAAAWSDETLFQEARKRVIAEIQAISYGEYLSELLTPGYAPPPYAGYNASVDARVAPVFAVAAYRYGHSGIGSIYRCVTSAGTKCPIGDILLRNVYFNPDAYLGGSSPATLGDLLRGLVVELESRIDTSLVDDVRNFLEGVGADLGSIDIFRGRDFGLPSYSATRVAYGLSAPQTFADITSDVAVASILKTLYGGDVSLVDLWVGGLAEAAATYKVAMLGPTFSAIIRDQFTRTRDGDRFFYLNAPNLKTIINGVIVGPYFPPADLAAIRATRLATIVARNIIDWPSPPMSMFKANSNPFVVAGAAAAPVTVASSTSTTGNAASGPCTSTISFSGQKVLMAYTPVTALSTTITITFTYAAAAGWLGFGVGGDMIGADLYWMQYSGGAGSVTQGMATAYAQPAAAATQSVTLVSSQQTASTTTWTWTRPLSGANSIAVGGPTNILFAWSAGSFAGGHGSNYLITSNDFSSLATCGTNGTIVQGEAGISQQQAVMKARQTTYSIHAMTMTFVWAFVLPTAVFSVRFFPHTSWAMNFHKVSGMMAATLTLPAAGQAMLQASGASVGMSPQPHQVLGLVIASLMIVQILLGAATRNWMRDRHQPPDFWFYVRRAHLYLGHAELIMASVNILLGLQLMYFSLNIVAGGILYFSLVGAAVVYYNSASGHGKSANYDLTAAEDNQRRHAMSTSAHSLSLSEVRERVRGGSQWVLFQGLIIDVASFMNRHPGGVYLIERNLGADITPWFVGREAYDESVPAHAHSVEALTVLRSFVVGALKTDPQALSWADAPDMPDAHASSRWTLAKRTVLRGETLRPVCKLVFVHAISEPEHALDWKPSSFGRYMVVRVPAATVKEYFSEPDTFWTGRALNAFLADARSTSTTRRAVPATKNRVAAFVGAIGSELSPFSGEHASPRPRLVGSYDDDRAQFGAGTPSHSASLQRRRPQLQLQQQRLSSSSLRAPPQSTPHSGHWYSARVAPAPVNAPAQQQQRLGPAFDEGDEYDDNAAADGGSSDERRARRRDRDRDRDRDDGASAASSSVPLGPSSFDGDDDDGDGGGDGYGARDDSGASGAQQLSQRGGASARRDLLERAYSVVRLDGGAGLVLYVRAYQRGLMSRVLHGLPLGAEIEMSGPRGTGLGLEDTESGIVVAIMQGTGAVTIFDLLQRIDAKARRRAASSAAAAATPAVERKFGGGGGGGGNLLGSSVTVAATPAAAADAQPPRPLSAEDALFASMGAASPQAEAPLIAPAADSAFVTTPVTASATVSSDSSSAPVPAARSRLQIVLMVVAEHEDAIIERDWLVHLHRTCPDVELHLHLKRPPARRLPNVTSGTISPQMLGALVPAENFRCVSICGSALFSRDMRSKLISLGLPKTSIFVV